MIYTIKILIITYNNSNINMHHTQTCTKAEFVWLHTQPYSYITYVHPRHTNMNTHIYTHARTHSHIHTCTHAHTHTLTHARTHPLTHTQRPNKYIYFYTYIHIYI